MTHVQRVAHQRSQQGVCLTCDFLGKKKICERSHIANKWGVQKPNPYFGKKVPVFSRCRGWTPLRKDKP